MDMTDVLIVPKFSNINFSIILSRPILLILLVVFFLIYAILSGVILYHWKSYGMKGRGVILAETLFLFVSLVLFVIAGVSMTYF